MKQLLLLISLVVISTSSFSQLNKNQFLVGGNASFSSSRYGDLDVYGSKESAFEISPNAGYFIVDRLAAGAKIGYAFYNSAWHYGNAFKHTTNSIVLSPFVRYYALPKKYKINLFGQVNYEYRTTKEKGSTDSTPERTFTTTQNGFNFIAGPVFFLNPYIALELTLSYNTYKPNDDYRTRAFMTGAGFQIHLGGNKNSRK